MENLQKNQVLNVVKEWRIRRGLTQFDAALELKVSPKTIYNWEHGKTSPPLYLLDYLK